MLNLPMTMGACKVSDDLLGHLNYIFSICLNKHCKGLVMIRVTGGEIRGRALKVFSGAKVRPTSDKVRQAIFNILEHRFETEISMARALDLFAGSGSLGAEFLSRGGAYLCAVESDSRTLAVLRTNLKTVQAALKHDDVQIDIVAQRVERYLKKPPQTPFEFIFIDPPYKERLGPKLLELLCEGWLTADGIVMIEHEKKDIFVPPQGWILDDRRPYGDTLISFLIKQE